MSLTSLSKPLMIPSRRALSLRTACAFSLSFQKFSWEACSFSSVMRFRLAARSKMPPQAVEFGLKRLNSLFDFLEHRHLTIGCNLLGDTLIYSSCPSQQRYGFWQSAFYLSLPENT